MPAIADLLLVVTFSASRLAYALDLDAGYPSKRKAWYLPHQGCVYYYNAESISAVSPAS
jgi:hypothetical protein